MTAKLYDYQTGDYLREATDEELYASIQQDKRDGGAGVIVVDGRDCYALEDNQPRDDQPRDE
jgi:hypothetical protein